MFPGGQDNLYFWKSQYPCGCLLNILVQGLAQFLADSKNLTYICWKRLKCCQTLQYQPSGSLDCPQTLATPTVLIMEPFLFHSVLRRFDSTWTLAIDAFTSLGLFNESTLTNYDLHLDVLFHEDIHRIKMSSLNTFFSSLQLHPILLLLFIYFWLGLPHTETILLSTWLFLIPLKCVDCFN